MKRFNFHGRVIKFQKAAVNAIGHNTVSTINLNLGAQPTEHLEPDRGNLRSKNSTYKGF
jgi:hypothetical protein